MFVPAKFDQWQLSSHGQSHLNEPLGFNTIFLMLCAVHLYAQMTNSKAQINNLCTLVVKWREEL